jgi:hypothetical protein
LKVERWELAAPNLETILARLDMCSGAPTPAYNSSGGQSSEDPGGKQPAGDNASPAAPYRRWLARAEQGHALRLTSAGEDEDAIERAYAALRSARAAILAAANKELESLTGRDGATPKRLVTKMDRDIRAVVEEDAPGKPADAMAERFGVSRFTVRRWYVEWQLDPTNGEPLGVADGWREMATDMADRLSERQIVTVLRSRGFAVERASVRRAIGRLKVAA